MNFLGLAKKLLKESKKPLSGVEIWQLALKNGYVNRLETEGKTPLRTLQARLYTAANDPNNPDFDYVGTRPKRFYLPEIMSEEALTFDEEKILEKKEAFEKRGYKEKDLHPVLAYYVRNHLGAFPKTLDHFTSRKKEFGDWVHPDMVGCLFPQNHWKHEGYDLSQLMGQAQIKLYSFELKKHLSFSNLRESFFQAVSNSSWAHEGYLVAPDVSPDRDFLIESRRLSDAFGIGVIQLDLHAPDETKVIFTSQERDVVDWNTVDKLMMNGDFKKFIARVKNDLSSKEVREEKYDKIPEVEELIQSFEGKL